LENKKQRLKGNIRGPRERKQKIGLARGNTAKSSGGHRLYRRTQDRGSLKCAFKKREGVGNLGTIFKKVRKGAEKRVLPGRDGPPRERGGGGQLLNVAARGKRKGKGERTFREE